MIRTACISDAEKILGLINFHAEDGEVLFRTLDNIRENIAEIIVSERDGEIVGTASLKYGWDKMVELRSLAVSKDYYRKGVGSELILEAINRAQKTDNEHIFVLTYAVPLFEKLGFTRVQKASLPLKIWSDCSECPKRDDCDEIAMIRSLDPVLDVGLPKNPFIKQKNPVSLEI
ncbi:MAG: N-acetyltransferase [Nitrospinales bacterium]